jgi:hypothetical protein
MHVKRTGVRGTYQLAIQATSITVQLVVQPPTPEGRMSCAAIGAFGLATRRRGVAGAALPQKGRVDASCGRTESR